MADVQKNAFMLSSATLMIAPAFTTDVFTLTPALHSVGLVRDIAIPVDSSLLELKNGIAQVTVDAKRTNVQASISASVYEFSARNLGYAASLVGSGPVTVKRGTLTTAITGGAGATSIVMNSSPVPGDSTSAITAIGDIPVGSWIILQSAAGGMDLVFPTKTTSAMTGTGPWTLSIAAGTYNVPTGVNFAIGDYVWVVTPQDIGSIDGDDLYGVKVTGTLSNYNRPVTCVFPKVRMMKGFNLSFSESDYGSMPWEMQPFLLTASEATGRLADIGTRAPGKVFIGA